MKKFVLSLFAFSAFVLTAFAADNVANKTLSVTSKARVIVPITLVKNTDMDFGVIARGTTGTSTITLGTSGSPATAVGGGDAVILSSAPQTAAKFTVSGESGKTYAITFPSSTIINGGVGNDLTVSSFACSNNTGGTIGTNDAFYIGASISITTTTAAASYTGSFNVTVAYN